MEEFSLFCGDLAFEVTDAYLYQCFRQYYPSTTSAKVVADSATGRSRGYGFVRFSSEPERDRAMGEMNGAVLCGRPVRLSMATPKMRGGGGGADLGGPMLPGPPMAGGAAGMPLQPPAAITSTSGAAAGAYGAGGGGDENPHNTVLFVGGLHVSVDDSQLAVLFGSAGHVVAVKTVAGRGCGFVQYGSRQEAEAGMRLLQGSLLANMPIRISWSKSGIGRTGGGGGSASGNYAAAYGAAAGGYSGYGYGGYDAYGGYYQDPYAYYGGAAAAAMGYEPAAAAGGYPAAGGAAGQQPAATVAASKPAAAYNPLAPVDVDAMNAAYVARHMPALTGSFFHEAAKAALA